MANKHLQIETENEAMGETDVEKSPLPKKGKKEKREKKGQLPQQSLPPPPSPSPQASDMEVCDEGGTETDYGGLEEIEAGLLEGTEETNTPTLTKEPTSTVERVVKTTQSAPPLKSGRIQGTLGNSIHAPSMSGAASQTPAPPAPLASKPALQAKALVSLAERLATHQQAILEKEKSEPWVFQPKPRGMPWSAKGCSLDAAGPYRAFKETQIQDLINPHTTVWAVLLGSIKHKAWMLLCHEGVKAFLRERENMDNPEVKTLVETGVWTLLQLLTPEGVSALVDQQGMLEIKECFLQDHKQAFALVREKMVTYFGIPEERIEWVPDFDAKHLDKIRIWDVKDLEDEEADRILTWSAMWGTRKSILTISSNPTIDIHMAYPCNWCHSRDYQELSCPWAQRGFLGEGRVLKIVPKREG
ncbi:hypothetical protein F5141DRAFT_1065895 [Pisolithus sp. B1]|nr:hypothetical protein F5141DRAFT_1065895 [Pisolithus sp. B1]